MKLLLVIAAVAVPVAIVVGLAWLIFRPWFRDDEEGN
jgi:ABC-type sulfate transport system permease subunit